VTLVHSAVFIPPLNVLLKLTDLGNLVFFLTLFFAARCKRSPLDILPIPPFSLLSFFFFVGDPTIVFFFFFLLSPPPSFSHGQLSLCRQQCPPPFFFFTFPGGPQLFHLHNLLPHLWGSGCWNPFVLFVPFFPSFPLPPPDFPAANPVFPYPHVLSTFQGTVQGVDEYSGIFFFFFLPSCESIGAPPQFLGESSLPVFVPGFFSPSSTHYPLPQPLLLFFFFMATFEVHFSQGIVSWKAFLSFMILHML